MLNMFYTKNLQMMSITDEEFREQHKPLYVPASYEKAQTIKDKVIFALADIGNGTVEQVVKRLEELSPEADHKPIIAATHDILTRLFQNGQLTGTDKDGDIVYKLDKITQANSGKA